MRLRGSVAIEHTLARRGAEKLWKLMHDGRSREHARRAHRQPGGAAGEGRAQGHLSLGLAGRGRRQQSPRDVSRPDALPGRTRCPMVVQRINNALQRADQIQTMEATATARDIDWFAPIVADAEAGFGGVLNAFELMKAMIEAGAAGVHFEDQLASVKKCGHMGGKVLVPTQRAVQKLIAARLAADVMGVPTLLLARTDAEAA